MIKTIVQSVFKRHPKEDVPDIHCIREFNSGNLRARLMVTTDAVGVRTHWIELAVYSGGSTWTRLGVMRASHLWSQIDLARQATECAQSMKLC